MFKALSRLFGSKPQKAPRVSIPVAGASGAQVNIAPIEAPSIPAAPDPAAAREKWKSHAAAPLNREASPEDLCGITEGMTAEQVRERLAKLYQRHNRAASSLDPQLREDAEFMLETLAGLRDKYFGGVIPP